MSVRWDPLLTAALARELSAAIGGSRVRGVLLDPAPRTALLFLHPEAESSPGSPSPTATALGLELHPEQGWVGLLDDSEPLPGSRPVRGHIVGVRALEDESALAIEIGSGRGRGGGAREAADLLIELSGNRWNAVLVERESRAIRQVLVARRGGRRPLEVGAIYEPPPATDRVAPRSAEEWRALVGEGASVGEGSADGGSGGEGRDDPGRARRILDAVSGTSSLNVASLTGPDGFDRWREIMDPATWGAYLIATDRGPQPYPVPLGRPDAERFPTLLDAFRSARARAPDAPPLHTLRMPSLLLGLLERKIARLGSEVRALSRELEWTEDPDALRSRGDLILARFHEIPPGAERVTLAGFDGTEIEMELDPTASPDVNAARIYDEAARAERARRSLPARIRAAEEKAAGWTTLLDRLRAGEADAEEAADALGVREDEGAAGSRGARRGGPGPERGASRRPRTGDALPYRRFRTSGGLEVRVGRSAARNDDLTFRHSAPDDVWLHARQAAGAHVVLRWNRKDNPPRSDLVEAACLAALHSEARHSSRVAVTWTRRKHVRKPRKAAAGSVTVERAETIDVEPDATLLERLAWGD